MPHDHLLDPGANATQSRLASVRSGDRKYIRALLLALCVLSPTAILLPEDLSRAPPLFHDLVRLARDWIPMIDRVADYGHPYPEKLAGYLAIAWTSVPLLLVALWRAHDSYCRPHLWGADRAWVVTRYLVVMVLALCALFLIAYWPSFSSGGWITGPLGSSLDARRRLFRTDLALAFSAPVWAVLAAGVVDAVCVETRALLQGIGSATNPPRKGAEP